MSTDTDAGRKTKREKETTPEREQKPEAGFWIKDDFYPWTLNDGVKDLILLDRVTGGMPTGEFFAAVRDEDERGRGPVLIGMMALSVRATHPEWSVNKIERFFDALDLNDVEYVQPPEVKTEDGAEDPQKSS